MKISGGDIYTNKMTSLFSGLVEEESEIWYFVRPWDNQTRTFPRMVCWNIANIFLKPPFFPFPLRFLIVTCSGFFFCVFLYFLSVVSFRNSCFLVTVLHTDILCLAQWTPVIWETKNALSLIPLTRG